MVNLQIPLLFDISAGGIVFGEQAQQVDVFDSHLVFSLGATSVDLSGEFQSIMYADASENDTAGVLFYSTKSNLSSSLGNAIEAAILGPDSKLIMKTTATYTQDDSAEAGGRYMKPGIPLPDYTITDYSGNHSGNMGHNVSQTYYTGSLTDATGTNFGRTLIRLMATHLMGHPFAQAFISNEESIINDISNSDLTNDIQNKLLKGNKISGDNSIATITQCAAGATVNKDLGINNGMLQAMYEGLLGTAPERFDLCGNATGTDVSGADLDSTLCRPIQLPFQKDDSISFYFRPHVHLTVDTNTAAAGTYTNDDLSGVGLGDSYSSAKTAKDLFFQPRHRWISYRTGGTVKASGSAIAPTGVAGATTGSHIDTYNNPGGGNTNGLAMTGTDMVQDNNSVSACEFDGHVWKITLDL
tara:strand:- start:4137 stop:5375 length:1239 start_codon:yes stop_codon:yes gene_type:complete